MKTKSHLQKIGMLMVFILAAWSLHLAFAATPPTTISYQGFLANASGTAISNATYGIKVELYDALTGGTALYTETHSSVTVTHGRFAIEIGSGTTSDNWSTAVDFSKALWLQITIDTSGTNEMLSPRMALSPGPYSRMALDVADSAITENKLVANLVFDDGDLLNLSSVDASGTAEGLILPQAADVSSASAEGQISWDTDNDTLQIGTGSGQATVVSTTGSQTLTNKTLSSPAISGGTLDNATIGGTTPSTGAFTTLSATGTATLHNVDINDGAIDSTPIGATTPSTGAFTTLSATGTATLHNVDINDGAIDSTPIGATTPSTGAFTTLSTSGAVSFNNTVSVTGITSFTGASTITGIVALNNGNTSAGVLKIYEDSDNGTNYTAFQAGVMSADVTYTLPTADGSEGQVLGTDGSGTLTWTTLESSAFSKGTNLISAGDSDDDFVFGSSQLADTGDTTKDARIIFDKSKAAFRAGKARSTEWDDSNVGDNSFASGQDSQASGTGSTALGLSTTASGLASTTMGQKATASGTSTTAMGDNITASSAYSTAVGRYNTDRSSESGTSWVTTESLFIVGNGTGTSATSDAFVVLKNGNATLAGSLTENSDIRLKNNVEPLSGILNKLLQLQGVSYEFKNTTTHPEGKHIGVIAQEIQKVFPELVSEDHQGYLSVSYDRLAPLLLEGLKEQQALIEQQQAALQQQQSELQTIKAALVKAGISLN